MKHNYLVAPNPIKRTPVRMDASIPVRTLALDRLGQARLSTRKGTLALLTHLADFGGQNLTLKKATPDFCRAFAQYLLLHVKPNSARTYLQKLHAIFQAAVDRGLLAQNPMPPIATLIPRFTPPERAFLSVEDLAKLEATPCPHFETRQAFFFACHTGLRLSDIETLRWEHIRRHDRGYILVKAQVKTGGVVRIPLDRTAIQILADLQQVHNPDGPVFHLLSRTIVSRDLHRWAAAAGIGKHLTFHVARHTFATLMVSQGVSIYAVSQLCGHADVRTTQLYARLIDPARFDAIGQLERALMPRHGQRTNPPPLLLLE